MIEGYTRGINFLTPVTRHTDNKVDFNDKIKPTGQAVHAEWCGRVPAANWASPPGTFILVGQAIDK